MLEEAHCGFDTISEMPPLLRDVRRLDRAVDPLVYRHGFRKPEERFHGCFCTFRAKDIFRLEWRCIIIAEYTGIKLEVLQGPRAVWRGILRPAALQCLVEVRDLALSHPGTWSEVVYKELATECGQVDIRGYTCLTYP